MTRNRKADLVLSQEALEVGKAHLQGSALEHARVCATA